METILIIGLIVVIVVLLFKNKPIKNSHKIPQIVEIVEFDNPTNSQNLLFLQRGFKLILSRESLEDGFHLFVSIITPGKDCSNVKKIIFSWSEWPQRIFSFNYFVSEENVYVEKGKIKIDVGSFNNCDGSKNFLKRTLSSETVTVDLLDFIPNQHDFEWENMKETKSVFIPIRTINDIKKFSKGRHYIDS